MKRWLLRLAVIVGGLALLGFLLAASGLVPIKASAGHWRITEWALRFGMKRSIATHSLTVKVPDNLADPSLVKKGAGYYEIGCRSCHGEPGMPPPRIAEHMLPIPPELTPRIRESNAKKLFYVVKHGMKFTGMPAWPAAERDDEVWAVVAFLLKYPELDGAGYAERAGRDATKRLASRAAAEGAPREHAEPAVIRSCATCHGVDGRGRGIDTMPSLAGQRGAYLRKALEAFAKGRRHSGMMGPPAAGLTADEMEEAAAYYAGLRARPEVAVAQVAVTTSAAGQRDVPARAAAAERGRVIALEGIAAQRVPACVECHGPGGRRAKPEYPLLAGQPAGYLELQLALFRADRRGGSDHAHLMQPIAARLTPEQAHDVAEYFAQASQDAAP